MDPGSGFQGMVTSSTNAEKLRSLPWALGGNAANVAYVYLTFSGPVFLLFLDELNLDKKQIGLVLALIPFCGVISVLTAPAAAWIGFKRTFLITWVARKFVLALLIITPWVLAAWGERVAFGFVVAVIFTFAVLRATAVGSFAPWLHELVPSSVRGPFDRGRRALETETASATRCPGNSSTNAVL